MQGTDFDVHGHVLLLREDGVVGLEVVLFEELLAVRDLHVEQGVAHAEELVGLRRHSVFVCVKVGREVASGSWGRGEERWKDSEWDVGRITIGRC